MSIYGAGGLEWHPGWGAGWAPAPDGPAMHHAPHALHPAVPPGASPPRPGAARRRGIGGGAAGLAPAAAALGPRAASAPLLGGYREAYRRLASGLAGSEGALYPPGHPFYSRTESADALRAENEKLRREIADLRAQDGPDKADRGGGGDGVPGAAPAPFGDRI